MNNKILICLDPLKTPFNGLGRVSIDFSTELLRRDVKDSITYLVPVKNHGYARQFPNIEFLTNVKKIWSGYMRKYDLVHVTHQVSKFSIRKAKKVVLTIHDLNFLYVKSSSKQKKYKRKVQKLVDKADYLCFISEFTKQECITHLTIEPDKPKSVIYNGVNNLIKSNAKPTWCPKGEFLFTVGQFTEKKNFHVLIPFLKLLPESVSLVIAGQNNTSYGEKIKAIVEKEGLNGRVILPHTISEEEKSYLYYHCKAFVFPSIAEGFGLPVIEAMKCNKPVFCSDKTSLKEIGNAFAFFWKTFAPHSMLKVYQQGVSAFDKDQEFQQRQKEYADSYTWKKNVDEYLKVYSSLLKTENISKLD